MKFMPMKKKKKQEQNPTSVLATNYRAQGSRNVRANNDSRYTHHVSGSKATETKKMNIQKYSLPTLVKVAVSATGSPKTEVTCLG